MPTRQGSARVFEPGTYGWTADDLLRPDVHQAWGNGCYEIIEGILAVMPPVWCDGSIALQRLIKLIERHLEREDVPGEFVVKATLVLNSIRVVHVDALFITPEYGRAQREVAGRTSLSFARYGCGSMAPPLVIESVIPGHESHDRTTKRHWYAEAKVPHYWILDAYSQSLECMVLDGGGYRLDQGGRAHGQLRPSLFPRLVLPLARLWGD